MTPWMVMRPPPAEGDATRRRPTVGRAAGAARVSGDVGRGSEAPLFLFLVDLRVSSPPAFPLCPSFTFQLPLWPCSSTPSLGTHRELSDAPLLSDGW